MAIYLKKFSTHAEYDTYINGSGAILPNVSICTTEGDVHYNPYVDPCKQYDYVEIGGVKWATKNVGACDITDTGLYFQWGDISGYTAEQVGSGEGQKYFDWADYKYGNGTSSPGATGMTKYNSTDGKTVLEASDDSVIANCSGQWRMPTNTEFKALGNAVTKTWTKVNGVYGILCTDKTDSTKTLFFPACGECDNGNVAGVGRYGYYWSSSRSSITARDAYTLYFDDGIVYWSNGDMRYRGYPVRGVVNE